ncbi:hypothetical protein Tco_1172752 [Tanacetum coccineum]
MAKPTIEEYITITRINHESGNERGRIELKGRFLIELSNIAFSGTSGEDAVERVEKFLKIADLLNVPNVSHHRLRVSIFLVSLTGAASEWFKDESIGSITKWVDLADKIFRKFYPPSRAWRIVETNEVSKKILWDPANTKFENWLASKFKSYKTMNGYTKNALWNYWKKGDDQEVMTNKELSDSEDGNLNEEEEFNYLLGIDVDVLTKDIPEFKTYGEYKDDWIYEWKDKIPWVHEKPWMADRVRKEPTAVKHDCKPFCFKSGHSEWSTCNWRDEGYFNGGNFPGAFKVSNTLRYQDYEWYEALEESDLKDEALRNKAALEESMNQEEESSNDDWSHYSPIDEWEDYEHDANIEADVNSNYNPYFDISRLFNDHTTKNDDKDVQDEMELNKDEEYDMGYLDDYLVYGNAPFIINEEEERPKERRCKQLWIPFTKPPAC